MPATGTYVYCLVSAERRPTARPRAARMPGIGPVRLLEVDRRLWMVVSNAPLNRYGEKALNAKLSDLDWVSRAAIAHEAVVESFIHERAILPMKLFTIFTSEDRALDQVRGDKRRVEDVVKRVANHLEWGVRVTLVRQPPPPVKKRARAPVSAPGASYLATKKAQRDRSAELAGRAQKAIVALYDRLSTRSRLAKRRAVSEMPIEGGPLLLDAAFLVPRSRGTRFRALVASEARRLGRSGYHLALTGPWPPYTFVKD
jgi:gas vesicle protein GvpL/GvpF